MDERFLAVSYIDECGIERRHYLLDTSEEDVSHREGMSLTGFLTVLNKPMVFHQGNIDFSRAYIDHEVFFIFLVFHQEI